MVILTICITNANVNVLGKLPIALFGGKSVLNCHQDTNHKQKYVYQTLVAKFLNFYAIKKILYRNKQASEKSFSWRKQTTK